MKTHNNTGRPSSETQTLSKTLLSALFWAKVKFLNLACQTDYTSQSPVVKCWFIGTTKGNVANHFKRLGAYIGTKRDVVVPRFSCPIFPPHYEIFLEEYLP